MRVPPPVQDERAARVLEFLMSPKVLSDKNLAELVRALWQAVRNA